jgi:hypothetical protein
MNSRNSCFALTVAAWMLAGSTLVAQEKDVTVEGQVKIGVHKFKLDDKHLYQFEVKGKNFEPLVQVIGNFIPNTVQFGKERNVFRGVFFPSKTAEYTLTVLPNIGFGPPEGLLDYSVTLKTMTLDETPILKKEDKITADDPKYQQTFRKVGFKAYPVKMKAGQTYIIDMVRTGGMDNKLDPFLHLENPMKQVINQNDDGGGFPNARIIYTATTDGEFRIIASGLSQFSELGDYTVTVRTVKTEK